MNDVLQELKTTLETAIGAKFNTYYVGEVALVPKSYCPALMVIPVSTNVVSKTTCEDDTTYTVTIRAVVDLNKFLDENGTGDTIKSQQNLINLMEERDSADGYKLKSDTVLGVIRDKDNLRGLSYKYNNDLTVEYSVQQRGEYFYVQAEVTFELYHIIERP